MYICYVAHSILQYFRISTLSNIYKEEGGKDEKCDKGLKGATAEGETPKL